MRSKSVALHDVTVQVKVPIADVGETVCISGNTPELGEWQASQAITLIKTDNSDIWSGTIKVPVDKVVQVRYMICVIIDIGNGQQETIVRRWENHLRPRVVSPTDVIDGKLPLVVFGYYNEVESLESGWLTAETLVQMKLFNNPVTVWKRRYRDKPLSIRVSTIDLSRKDSEVTSQTFDEDSTLPDGAPKSAWPIVEIAVMNEENWEFTKQSQFGHILQPEDYINFQIQMIDPETIAYMVDFYSHGPDIPEHIGFCYILPSNMRDTSGTCNMPISGKRQQPVGQLSLEYLIIKPIKEYRCDLSITYSRHWKTYKKGLDVGHRGAGHARRNDKVENVLENTVASFNYAARHGADMVELDVQLSKDMVPVIYHDYYICINMKKKRSAHEHELLQLAVKDLTAKQLQMLKLSPAKADGKHKHDFHDDDYEDNQPFPTLKHVLEAVDHRVGVNIEIKCPMQLRDGTWELDHRFDLNVYVDIILRDILQNAGDRYIILSCFHPDICTMVRMKQNKYPLLFLTQGQTDKYPPYLDTRTSSIPMATYFALNSGLLGINVHAEDLLRDSSLINFVKEHSLILFCWGEDINHSDVIKSLKEQGVDGVIYDKVDEFTTAQENVFLVDSKARMGILEIAGSGTDSIDGWSSTSTS